MSWRAYALLPIATVAARGDLVAAIALGAGGVAPLAWLPRPPRGRASVARAAFAIACPLLGAAIASQTGAPGASAAMAALAWAVAALAWLGPRIATGSAIAFTAGTMGALFAATAATVPAARPYALYDLVGLVVAIAAGTPVRDAAERIDDAIAALRRDHPRRARSLFRTVRRRIAGSRLDLRAALGRALAEIDAAAVARSEDALHALAAIAAALIAEGDVALLIDVVAAERRIGGERRLESRLAGGGLERRAALQVYLCEPGATREAARRAAAGLMTPAVLRSVALITRRALHNRFKHGGLTPGRGPLKRDALRGLVSDLDELARVSGTYLWSAERTALAVAVADGDHSAAALAAMLESPLGALAGLLWLDVAPVIEAAVAAAAPLAIELDIAPEVTCLAAPISEQPLRDALDNLLWNARGPATVRARIAAGTLEIEVADRGPGPSSDAVAAARAKGSGLAIASRAAAELGGELQIVDGVGVRVRVPLGG